MEANAKTKRKAFGGSGRTAGWLVVGLLILAGGLVGAQSWHRHLVRNREIDLPILMYHRIGQGGDSVWWVPREVFAAQMQFLADQGYTTVLPSDVVAHRRRGIPLPAKPILITFDDGHLNALTEAEPILLQHGFRAVNFLITDYVADRAEARRDYEGAPCLIWPEVLAMQERGAFVFGGHSRSHANLRAMGRCDEEVQGCWDELVRNGVREPEGFCYPFGQFRDETVDSVKRSSFRIAFVTEDRRARVGPGHSLYTVPRVSVYGGARQFDVGPARWDAERGEWGVDVVFTGRKLWGQGYLLSADQTNAQVSTSIKRFEPGTNRLRWSMSQPPAPPVRLEIWDGCRVFRHFAADLTPGS